IRLVLNDASRKVVRVDLDALAVPVERAHLDARRPGDTAADVGDAQAAFPPFDSLVADGRNLGVDERRRLALALLVGVEHGDEQPYALVDLGSGQANARILLHGLDHVVDELLELRGPN